MPAPKAAKSSAKPAPKPAKPVLAVKPAAPVAAKSAAKVAAPVASKVAAPAAAKAATKAVEAPKAVAPKKTPVTIEAIRARAEAIWRERVRRNQPGDEVSDWTQAERELKG